MTYLGLTGCAENDFMLAHALDLAAKVVEAGMDC